MPCWITIVQDGMAAKHFPMAEVPRVGDFIDLVPGTVSSDGYVEVTRIVWPVPHASDAQLLELKEDEMPSVRVYVRKCVTKAG